MQLIYVYCYFIVRFLVWTYREKYSCYSCLSICFFAWHHSRVYT